MYTPSHVFKKWDVYHNNKTYCFNEIGGFMIVVSPECEFPFPWGNEDRISVSQHGKTLFFCAYPFFQQGKAYLDQKACVQLVRHVVPLIHAFHAQHKNDNWAREELTF
jgi:hypothetical protein